MRITFFVISFLLFSSSTNAQSYWKIKTESGEEILLTIDIDEASQTFKAYTRENAIKDIAGFVAYNLARTAGKLKYPEIVYIEGKTKQLKDSLKLDGVFYYTDKHYTFQAALIGTSFMGKYTDNRNRVHVLSGGKVPDNKPIRDYQSILNSAIRIAEQRLADPKWLKSGDWIDFKTEINRLKPLVSDDYELGAVIMWNGRKLPFSPFEISKRRNIQQKPNPAIKIVKQGTVLIDGNGMPSTVGEMDSLAQIISKNSISKLIIDLRGRSSVTPEKCLILLNYLAKKEFTGGYFVSQKWWNSNQFAPGMPGSKSIPVDLKLSPNPLKFADVNTFRLQVSPLKNTFKGKVFVFTDSRTSRVSEALTYIIKQEKMATIIGHKTAGMPFLTGVFEINNEFEIQLPTSVFYDRNGKNPAGSGVEPDSKISNEDLMNFVFQH